MDNVNLALSLRSCRNVHASHVGQDNFAMSAEVETVAQGGHLDKTDKAG